MEFKPDSLFRSAFRKFFNAIAVVLGLSLALVVVIVAISALSDNVSLPQHGDLTVSRDVSWNRKLLSTTTPVILRIDLHGIIGLSHLTEEKFQNMLLDSREGSLAGNRVKGILLHVNTPGGTAIDSAAIYSLFQEYKARFNVPIFVYVDGLCASGGMYIASAADQIFASGDSIIGSVGVKMGPVFNVSDLIQRIGISSLTITEGIGKDALNSFRPWKEDEAASFQTIAATSYETFLDVVTQGRKQLSRDKLIHEYGAKVFSAAQSQEYGYIDVANASYNDALKGLVQKLGLAEGSYQVLAIEPYHSTLEDLTQSSYSLLKGKVQHMFHLAPNITTELELAGKLLYLYQP